MRSLAVRRRWQRIKKRMKVTFSDFIDTKWSRWVRISLRVSMFKECEILIHQSLDPPCVWCRGLLRFQDLKPLHFRLFSISCFQAFFMCEPQRHCILINRRYCPCTYTQPLHLASNLLVTMPVLSLPQVIYYYGQDQSRLLDANLCLEITHKRFWLLIPDSRYCALWFDRSQLSYKVIACRLCNRKSQVDREYLSIDIFICKMVTRNSILWCWRAWFSFIKALFRFWSELVDCTTSDAFKKTLVNVVW